jgi:hypothetical protein
MTTYQGFKVFSHVVLAMMLAGIALRQLYRRHLLDRHQRLTLPIKP